MVALRNAFAPAVNGMRRVITCHSATLSGRFPPNSLAAVEECVTAGVPRLEIDVRFMADDSMVIFHDDWLDRDATGCGSVAALRREEIAEVRYRSDEAHGLCFLEDVVDTVRGSRTLLQVDLKLMRPITPARVELLTRALAPLGDQLIVGSQAHWNLRPLAPLPLALDPWLQFHARRGADDPPLPANRGIHGLWDDSPYARNPRFTAEEYIEARLEDTSQLLPQAREWMVDVATTEHIAGLGVELGGWLEARGCELAVWTFREATPHRAAIANRMAALGATTFITDCPELLAQDLAG